MKKTFTSSLVNANVANTTLAHFGKEIDHIPYATGSVTKVFQGHIVSQQYSNYIFSFESVDIFLESALAVPFTVKHRSLIMVFVLEGQVRLENGNNDILDNIEAKTCYCTINQEGDYLVTFPRGRHRIVYISLDIGWIRSEAPNFPHLQNFISGHQAEKNHLSFMSKIFLCAEMESQLRSFLKIPNKNRDTLSEILTSQVKLLIKAYDRFQNYNHFLSALSQKEKIQEIKKYLNEHYYEVDCTKIFLICERFNITERTFRRAFKAEESQTPIAYIHKLRLSHGKELLLKTDNTVSKIAAMCGFNSLNFFSRLFRKYYQYSPEKYKAKFFGSPSKNRS